MDGEETMSANNKQYGGTHYQGKIQVWDFVSQNKIPYLEGNIIKYICRYDKKNGLEDLEKAKHYLEKLIEITKGREELEQVVEVARATKIHNHNSKPIEELEWEDQIAACRGRDGC